MQKKKIIMFLTFLSSLPSYSMEKSGIKPFEKNKKIKTLNFCQESSQLQALVKTYVESGYQKKTGKEILKKCSLHIHNIKTYPFAPVKSNLSTQAVNKIAKIYKKNLKEIKEEVDNHLLYKKKYKEEINKQKFPSKEKVPPVKHLRKNHFLSKSLIEKQTYKHLLYKGKIKKKNFPSKDEKLYANYLYKNIFLLESLRKEMAYLFYLIQDQNNQNKYRSRYLEKLECMKIIVTENIESHKNFIDLLEILTYQQRPSSNI